MYRFLLAMVNGQSKTPDDFLSSLIIRAEEGSPLFLAYNAVECAYGTKKTKQYHCIPEPAQAYSIALSSICCALQDRERHKSDSTLLAAWLLGLYEVCSEMYIDKCKESLQNHFADIRHMQLILGTQDATSLQAASSGWNIHNQGLTELVRVRGEEQFKRQDGRNLFWVVFNTIVSVCQKKKLAFP